MYECFVSSRLAAAATLDLLAGRASSLEPYEAAVEAALAPLHRASWKLKQRLRPLAARLLAAGAAPGRLAQHRAAAARAS